METQDLREHWNLQAPIYASDEGHRRFGRFLELYEEACWRYIAPVLPQPGSGMILEAGCGTGRWVTHLAPQGHRMVLADLSPDMVAQARSKVERLGLGDRVVGYHALDICELHALSDASFELVLALGGPLSLCGDAGLAVKEFYRVTKPGGYVICDGANRYRTALDTIYTPQQGQLTDVLDTGQFRREDGLNDHRFDPQELAGLFAAQGWQVVHQAGICPLFAYLPSAEQVRLLNDDAVFEAMGDIGRRYEENPFMAALAGRLLIVARKGA